jgi:hypothetical protein
LPVITVIGIEAAFLIGGLIVTETVFNIPGVARFLVEALRWRDYPIVQNLVMLIAVVVVLANFTVDMLYAVTRPAHPLHGLGGRLAAINYDSELKRAGAMRPAWLAQAGVPGATLYARHGRPVHHGDVRVGGGVCRPDLPLRSALTVDSAHALTRPTPCTGWEPTRLAATSGAGSSTARAFRSPSASARPRSARRSASSSA